MPAIRHEIVANPAARPCRRPLDTISRLRDRRVAIVSQGGATMRTAAVTALVLLIPALQPTVAAPAETRAFRVEVVGRGNPMILIPGLSSSGDTWEATVARYKDRFTCHVLTLAGFAGVPAIEAPLMSTV